MLSPRHNYVARSVIVGLAVCRRLRVFSVQRSQCCGTCGHSVCGAHESHCSAYFMQSSAQPPLDSYHFDHVYFLLTLKLFNIDRSCATDIHCICMFAVSPSDGPICSDTSDLCMRRPTSTVLLVVCNGTDAVARRLTVLATASQVRLYSINIEHDIKNPFYAIYCIVVFFCARRAAAIQRRRVGEIGEEKCDTKWNTQFDITRTLHEYVRTAQHHKNVIIL